MTSDICPVVLVPSFVQRPDFLGGDVAIVQRGIYDSNNGAFGHSLPLAYLRQNIPGSPKSLLSLPSKTFSSSSMLLETFYSSVPVRSSSSPLRPKKTIKYTSHNFAIDRERYYWDGSCPDWVSLGH